MRFLVLFLALLLFFVWLGLKIQADPGYILIAYQQWTIETPLWMGVTLILVAFIVLYALVRLLGRLSNVTTRWRMWMQQRRLRRSHERTSRGLIELAEGRWKVAEKNLIKAAQNAEMPLINYLSAARAAQELGEHEKRDDYLHKAHMAMPAAEIAVGLTQAQLQVNHQQLEQALATLRRLHDLSPKHAHVLKLLQKIYLDLQDYGSLEALLPSLKKAKVLSAAEFSLLQQKIFVGLLEQLTKLNDNDAVQAVWDRIPKDLQQNPTVLLLYVNYLLKTRQFEEAEQLLRAGLKAHWDDGLVRAYGLIESADPDKQLSVAESWLKLHPDSAALLLCLGRICIRNHLWGKARSYLETCLSLAPSAEVYSTLAQLLEQMNDPAKAADYYRKGLLLATK